MSPIHHHFELLGWPETTVIIRFWLIAAVCVAAALGLFIGDFTRISADAAVTRLVYGLAVAGAATCAALLAAGVDVVAADDAVDERKRALADELGVELARAPRRASWPRSSLRCDARRAGARRARDATACSPSPRRPAGPSQRARAGLPTGSRSAPAGRGRCSPSPAPTARRRRRCSTVAMLAGRAVCAPSPPATPTCRWSTALDLDVDAFVVECTSFRLAWTERFRGDAAAWLNLAPDHLNWHAVDGHLRGGQGADVRQQRPGDVAIGFADDPVVMRHLAAAPGRRRTFALDGADYRVEDGGAARRAARRAR